MRISILETKSNAIIEQREITWDELKSVLTKHDTRYEDKKEVPMFSPCEFREGFSRSNGTALRVHFGVIDLDDISAEDFENIKKKLALTTYVCYTTWRHSKENELQGIYRLRIVFPFNRAIEESEWKDFWPRLHLFFDKLIDAQCKDIQRGYFFPACVNPHEHWNQTNVGLDFDVDALLGKSIEALKPVHKLTKQDLIDLKEKLKKGRTDHKKEMAEVIGKAIDGEELAENGNRDNTYFKLAGVLAKEFPTHSPYQVAALFSESLLAATKQGCDKSTPELFAKKIEKAQSTLELEKEQKKQEQLSEIAGRINVAFGGKRTHAYTNEELKQFAEDSKTTIQEFSNHWIININGSYYIYFDGSYRPPCSEKDLLSHCHKYLAPAITAGVEITKKDDKDKLVFKPVNEILAEYGQPADSIVADMTLQKSYFDVETKTLMEAVCPLRVTEPEFSQDVDTFISLMGGNNATVLRDFMSAATDLNKPCAAIYLHSPPGYGKGTFMEGMARLWTTGAYTTLTSALKEFNAKLSKCPLVVADENMPKKFREDGNTGELREFIQAKSREIRRLYKETATLNGAVRLIIAANNPDLLDTQENLSKNDIDAIAERVCYIDCENEASRKFLESLGTERYNKLISGDAIAKHALWLKENHKIEYTARFLIKSQDNTFHKNMMVSTGLPASIANWLVSYLQAPNLIDCSYSGLVRVLEGQLLVNTKALGDHWDTYTTNVKAPSPARLGKALNRLTLGQVVRKWKGKPIRYWIVDTESLIAWATTNNYSTKEEILAALQVDTHDNTGVPKTLSDVLSLKKPGELV